MDFEHNETERMLADTLARFAAQTEGMDGSAQRAHCVAMGWHGASVAEDLGGFGMGMIAPMLVAEHLGAALSALDWQTEAVLPAIRLEALARQGNPAPLEAFLAGELPGDDGVGARLDPSTVAAARMGAEITAAATHLGAMQRLFDMTLDYTKTRHQFGRPLSSFQALQHRLVDMLIALDEARALVMAAAMAATEMRDDAPALSAAAWAKTAASGQQIAEEAIQLHGGIGMTAECRVGDYVKLILRNAPCVPTEAAA